MLYRYRLYSTDGSFEGEAHFQWHDQAHHRSAYQARGEAALTPNPHPDRLLGLAAIAPSRARVHIKDVPSSPESRPVEHRFHCCEWTRVFRYDPASNSYTVSQHLWGDPGYKLEQIGKQLLFVSADDRFAYAFTDSRSRR